MTLRRDRVSGKDSGPIKFLPRSMYITTDIEQTFIYSDILQLSQILQFSIYFNITTVIIGAAERLICHQKSDYYNKTQNQVSQRSPTLLNIKIFGHENEGVLFIFEQFHYTFSKP